VGADIASIRGAGKLNHIDPEAWLADVLRRINDQPRLRVGIYTNSRYPLNVGLEGPLCCP
jgi:hypothetical protein